MCRKRFGIVLLSCVLMLSSAVMSVSAAELPNNGDGAVVMRAAGRLDYSIPAKTLVPINVEFSLAKGDTIEYDCTYTPKSASVDFGYIAPNGLFYSINCTSGSFNKSFKVNQTGQYTLAIRNNASYAVTVTGTVRY